MSIENFSAVPPPKQAQETLGINEAQESLEANLERLRENLLSLDHIDIDALRLTEGKEATGTLFQSMSNRFSGFGSKIKEKITTGVASLDDGDRVAKVLGSVASVGILGPVFLQILRSKWPEAGVALDAMPDIVQHLAHLDIASRLSDVLGGSGQMFVWDTGNTEGMNVLADISSGKVDYGSLDGPKLEALQQTLPPDSLSLIEKFSEQEIAGVTAQDIAGNQNGLATAMKTLGNTAFIGGPLAAIGAAAHKVGGLARRSLNK